MCVCVSGERKGGYKSHHGFNGFTRNAEIERGGSNECVGVEMMVLLLLFWHYLIWKEKMLIWGKVTGGCEGGSIQFLLHF